MNRIRQRMAELSQSNRKALVTYIVNGDPRPDVTLEAMHTLVASGADIIELGIPFSDPMAEGPVIQRGHERSLSHNTSLKDTFELVKAFRTRDNTTPIVLMGYANPLERIGYAECAVLSAQAGVDGMLTVDLPAEEAGPLNEVLRANDLETIFLVAPTTRPSRIEKVASLAGGFIYYVSLKGVTGAGHLDTDSVKQKVAEIKQYTDLPILVGFGIKDAESASAVGAMSDGVVVGSVLVEAMGKSQDASAEDICATLAQIVKPMREALDR